MRSAHKQKNPTISNVKSLDLWSEWRESNSRPLEPHNGTMKDLSVLQEPPFTDQGSIVEVFTDLSVWLGIRKTIEQVNANAIAA